MAQIKMRSALTLATSSRRGRPGYGRGLLRRRRSAGINKNARRYCVSWSPVVLKRNAHHGITGHIFLLTARVQHRALRDRPGFQNNDFEAHLAADVRQGSEMEGGMTRIMGRSHLTKALRNDSSPRLKLAII